MTINLDLSSPRAAIAYFASDGRAPSEGLTAAAAAARYVLLSPAEIDESARKIDIAIVDIDGAIAEHAALIADARRHNAHAGVVVISSQAISAADRKNIGRVGEHFLVRGDKAGVVPIIRERLRLAALADETGDRLKSLVADGRAVDLPKFKAAPPALSILIAGKPSPLLLSATNTVNAAQFAATSVFTAGQVMRALDHQSFDGLLFLPTDENDLLLALARALRRHREHRKLPVTIAVDNDDLATKCAARYDFDVSTFDDISESLADKIAMAARRSRMAAEMRAFLATNGGAGPNPGARFFAHHATRVFNRASETGKPLSLVAVALNPISSAATAEQISTALSEARRTATRLLRAEDMMVRLTTQTLVALLRGADQLDSERVASRLEGVISGSIRRSVFEFADISACSAECDRSSDVETAIARLILKLRVRRRRAAAAV